MTRVVMEKQELVHLRIKRQRNHAAERTMAPADVLRVLWGNAFPRELCRIIRCLGSAQSLLCSCVSITLIMRPTRVPQLREDHLGTLEVLRVDGDHADLHQNSAPRGTFICHLVLRKRRNEVPPKQLNGN